MSGSQQLLIARHSFNLIKFSEDNLIRFGIAELFQSKCVCAPCTQAARLLTRRPSTWFKTHGNHPTLHLPIFHKAPISQTPHPQTPRMFALHPKHERPAWI